MNKLLLALLLIPGIAGASINRVENNLVTTAKLANGSVTTPKLHGEALDGYTADGKLLININGTSEIKQLKTGQASTLHLRGISGQESCLQLSADGASQSADTWKACSTAANDLTFTNSAISATMVMDNAGNVGIGTASPGYDLVVGAGADTTATTGANTNIYATNDGDTAIVARNSTANTEVFMYAGGGGVAYVGGASGTEVRIQSGGADAITVDTSQKTSFASDSVVVTTAQSPASNAACTAGEIAWDATYIYICTASTVWKRVALTGAY